MNQLLNTFLVIVILSTANDCLSQDLTYGQLHDYIQFNWDKAANDTIYCNEFFQILDTVAAEYLVTYDCNPFPGLQDYRQLLDNTKYPDSIDIYEISGKVFVYTLIDTAGNLYCYKIKTELGASFINEAERVLKSLNFVEAKCGGISKAYHFSFPITFEYSAKKKKKRNSN